MKLLVNVKDETEVRGHAPQRDLGIRRRDADHRARGLARGDLVEVVDRTGDAANAGMQEEREVLLAELEADPRVREVVADLVEQRRAQGRIAADLLDDTVRVALEEPAVADRDDRRRPRP